MNYIKQVNAFYNHLETNQLTASAANLWHVLMQVNNRAGWRQEFTAAMSMLCYKANLTVSTFKRARNELQEKGYIRVKSRGGSRAASYQIVSLDRMTDEEDPEVFEMEESGESGADDRVNHNLDHKLDRNNDQKMDDNMNHNVSQNADPLIKQNKTKQNDTTNATDAIRFFQDNFGGVSPYVAEDMIHWINELGESLVLYAMKRALERGRLNWGYVKAILDAWVKKGIRNVEDARAEEVEYRRQRERKVVRESGGYRAGSKGAADVVPDWFRERKRREKKQDVVGNRDSVGLRESVERRLVEYRGDAGMQVPDPHRFGVEKWRQ
ncbi:DnaD domain protein [Oceanobacillus saliphilus]|uniref:DnaD domain protein n=1 Tax=Oceanobacillus saliphilus TaxID=2925834 RepID=UPI00201E5AA9|nr:DnaD domain protein [Oceanobacillus saliphilus]